MRKEPWGGRHGVVGRVRSAAPYLAILLGVVVLAWPPASRWWEAWQASQGIQAVTGIYDEMNDPERAAVRKKARRYNQALVGNGDLAACDPYEQQLSFGGSEMIAYISIPRLAVRLPIFHGTEDRELMVGVGHLRQSSLPTGGPSTHCVLTAHSGMPGRVMFDDIGLLEPGDRFVVWVLGEPLAYEVVGSEVVLPTQTESLSVVTGEDLCTLVTCTPYGVNTHRLLVHARRCAYEAGEEQLAHSAVYVNRRTAPFLLGLVAVALFAAIPVFARLTNA